MSDRFDLLLQRYLTGSLTSAERTQFLDMIASGMYDEALDAQLVLALQTEEAGDAALADLIYNTLLRKINDERSNKKTFKRVYPLKTAWFRYAAAVFLIFGLAATGYILLNGNTNRDQTALVKPSTNQTGAILPGSNKAILTLSDGRQVEIDSAASGTITDQNLSIENDNGQLKYRGGGLVAYNTMTTSRGGQYQVVLPDGTKVWLNAASSITYPTAFPGNNRTVNIEGEAYFEVAMDEKKPFIVEAPTGTVIKVLGTAFNVNTYTNESLQRITLVEGAIRVQNGKTGKVLSQDHQVIIENSQMQLQKVNTNEVIAWKNGYFNFEGADLKNVMRQLERWYDIQVVYGPKTPQRVFEGRLPRNLYLHEVLDIFGEVDIPYRVENKTVYIGE